MHQDDGPARRHHNVRLVRQVAAVESEPAAQAMHDRTDHPLRPCVLAAIRGHAPAALRGRGRGRERERKRKRERGRGRVGHDAALTYRWASCRAHSRNPRPGAHVGTEAPRLRPEGAPECSHGWSAARREAGGAEPVEGGSDSVSCPGGAEEVPDGAAPQSNTYFSSNSIPWARRIRRSSDLKSSFL